MLSLSQQPTKRTREAIPPPEIIEPPTVPPQVGSKYFYCWQADHVDYEVQVIQVLSRYQVLIKFSAYPREKETISVQHLLPHTQERVDAFCQARRNLSERDQEAREQARAEAKERRMQERLEQQQAKEKRLTEEKEERRLLARKRFGRGRLIRNDIPQDYEYLSQPGQTVRLSHHRIVYFAKEDETAAIIADCFRVDVDLLLFDNQIAYPGITAKRKLKEYTSLVMHVLESEVKEE
jgi:hypothetical protein